MTVADQRSRSYLHKCEVEVMLSMYKRYGTDGRGDY
jgi:hypothetical protein